MHKLHKNNQVRQFQKVRRLLYLGNSFRCRCQALLARLEPLDKFLCESKGVANEETPLHIVPGTQVGL